MTNAARRRLREGHLLPFSTSHPRDIETLLDSLNDDQYGNRDAVREMVRNMNAVDGVVQKKAVPVLIHPGTPGLQKKLRRHGFDESFVNRIEKIRDTFDSSRFKVATAFPVKGRWRFELMLPPTRDKLKAFYCLDLNIIRDLSEYGRLRRVRECPCGRWFFAYRPTPRYRFHSNACRDKYWRSTPQGKARRRDFTRDYRRRQKEIDEANLEESKRPEKRR
jgi:hypothetical protein